MSNLNIIITGGGGSGKTSIINYINQLGICTFSEVSRKIIKEQQQINGTLLPWNNLLGFGMECLNRMQHQLSTCSSELSFFDRGIPDIAAYFMTKKLKFPQTQFKPIKYYSKIVFICPPWKEIFINDPQRPETYEQSCKIYNNLKITYTQLGFKLIEIPKKNVPERVNFIMNYIRSENYFKATSKTLPSLAK